MSFSEDCTTDNVKQCRHCGKYIPTEQFSNDSRMSDGLYYYCKQCEHKTRKRKRENLAHDRDLLIDATKRKLGGCQKCGCDYFPCLFFYRLPGSGNSLGKLSNLRYGRLDNLLKELSERTLLCPICYSKLSAK